MNLIFRLLIKNCLQKGNRLKKRLDILTHTVWRECIGRGIGRPNEMVESTKWTRLAGGVGRTECRFIPMLRPDWRSARGAARHRKLSVGAGLDTRNTRHPIGTEGGKEEGGGSALQEGEGGTTRLPSDAQRIGRADVGAPTACYGYRAAGRHNAHSQTGHMD